MISGLLEQKIKMASKEELFIDKRHLGKGTFGSVEKCISKQTGQTYAVKVIENVSSMDLDKIQSEIEAMKRAKSDYSVELIDNFYDSELMRYILVMPFYRKGSLSDSMKLIKSPTEIISFLYQITMAFLSINKHSSCCWHLDLKPDNILVKSQGEYLICDFGCAKLIDSIDISRMDISMGKGAGTTRYAAPEVILDFAGGKYSDVWSLGIILYEILYNGQHPFGNFNGSNCASITNNYRNGKIKINYPSKPGYEKIIEICKKMLEPKKRPLWSEMHSSIFNILGLPKKTSLIVNIEKLIKYVHNLERITMGLIYYLEKNKFVFEKLDMTTETEKIIDSIKEFTYCIFSEVNKTIEGEPKIKPGHLFTEVFYLFPEIRKTYKIQDKLKFNHLWTIISNYCSKKANKNYDFSNIRLSFLDDIDRFYGRMKVKAQSLTSIPPQTEFSKIEMIFKFILLKNEQKSKGLEFEDKEKIDTFAHKVIFD